MRRPSLLLLALLPAIPLSACVEADDKSDEEEEEGEDVDDTGEVVDGGDAGGDAGDGGDAGGDAGGGEAGGGEAGDDAGGGDAGGGDAGGGEAGGDDGPPPPLLPNAGTWTPSVFTVTSDTCGLGNFEDPANFIPASFEISNVSESGFDIADPAGAPTACAYTEPTFACDAQNAEESVSEVGATLLLETVFLGTVTSETAIAGEIDLTVTCDGGGCFLLELAGLRFPCPLTGTFDLSN